MMKTFRQFFLLIGLMLSSLAVVAAQNDPGRAYFDRGQFELAVQHWAGALSTPALKNNPKRYIDTSVRLATAYQCELRVKTFASNENNRLENQLVDTRQMVNFNNVIFQ